MTAEQKNYLLKPYKYKNIGVLGMDFKNMIIKFLKDEKGILLVCSIYEKNQP